MARTVFPQSTILPLTPPVIETVVVYDTAIADIIYDNVLIQDFFGFSNFLISINGENYNLSTEIIYTTGEIVVLTRTN